MPKCAIRSMQARLIPVGVLNTYHRDCLSIFVPIYRNHPQMNPHITDWYGKTFVVTPSGVVSDPQNLVNHAKLKTGRPLKNAEYKAFNLQTYKGKRP